MSKSFVRPRYFYPSLALLLAFAALPPSATRGTGAYSAPTWLEKGGAAVDHSPEFYWAIQMQQMAAAYRPMEKPVRESDRAAHAARVDLADFQDAIQTGRLKPADPAIAKAKQAEARKAIAAANESTTAALPTQEPSEFADYNQGAFAMHSGQSHYAAAKAAWEALLNRPKEQRHYRSVWAAFMLGKLALYQQQPEAVQWFQKTRQLAKEGFADSLGLAADSYGWEAKSELELDHLEKAAPLYLTQLALGDESAIVSLKALIPDRAYIWGVLNFPPLPPDNGDEAAKKKYDEEQARREAKLLARAAKDPLLRRITSAHILATETVMTDWLYQDTATGHSNEPAAPSRCQRWLDAIEKANIEKISNADQLGWIAYTAGRYREAARWLKRCDDETATSLWLKAKLLRRDGELNQAAKLMAQVVKSIAEDPAWREPTDESESEVSFLMGHEGVAPAVSATGDLGALHLSRGDFIAALEAFDEAGLADDAAFIADNILTADELKAYVDQHAPWTTADEDKAQKAAAKEGKDPDDIIPNNQGPRSLLASHLVRDRRYDEARPYFRPAARKILDRYVAALAKGADESLDKTARARAWFDAALIARNEGRELMATWGQTSHLNSDQPFPPTDTASERRTGATYEVNDTGAKPARIAKPLQLYVPVTAQEKKRLIRSQPPPNQQHHQLYTAAAHAWKAALLLPDDTPELADVLNTAGLWIQNDERAADKFFQAIEKRARNTALGQAANKKHWFIHQSGPWSPAPEP